MNKKIVDISKFRKDQDFYPELSLLLTIKSFDQLAIRKRYLESRARTGGKRAGSVERRAVTEGGVVHLRMNKGKLLNEDVLIKLPEPRGIDVRNSLLALSSENKVFIIGGGEVKSFTDKWFSYIHTVHFSPKNPENEVVVSSSGFDCLKEYNFKIGRQRKEWFAWENGFNIGRDPQNDTTFLLTRSPEVAAAFKEEALNHLLIDDPENQVLPTAKRAAFINSVLFDTADSNAWLATFFHEGAVYSINRLSGATQKVVEGMKNPHGGRRYKDGYLATSTGTGDVVFKNDTEEIWYDFGNIEGKPSELGELEWLQNTIPVEDCLITIDSNRNSIVIFNPEKELYDIIEYDINWAVQDLVDIRDSELDFNLIRNLK